MFDNLDSPEWVKDAIFYQIFPERFANGNPENDPAWVLPWGTPPTPQTFMGGDLQGVLDHLPYLCDLGVNVIYMTPVFTARSNHKYDTSDYFQVDPIFGDKELLKKLVTTAHENNIRVILDAVFNHCGDGFWAFQDVIEKGRDSHYCDWFVLDKFPIDQNPPNYQTCGGAGFLPKLNITNPSVKQYLLDAAVYWMEETDIDGWRLDVPWKVPLAFWREFRQKVKQIRPDAYIVAEAWRDGSRWLQGDTCDAVMNYPMRDYILDYCARDAMDAEDFDHFVTRLYEIYGHAAPMQLNLLGSHDTARLLTLCGGDVSRAVLAFICMFTGIGAPMIYYGDENGMVGENDPDCRRCMDWDDGHWNETIRNAVKKLTNLRNEHPALRTGRYETLLTFNGVYAYRRSLGDDQVIIVTNPRDMRKQLTITLPASNTINYWIDVLSGLVFTSDEKQLLLPELQSRQGLVLIPFTQ
ncbi:MAG: glycoside hydrolase family 13 protein [Chloroflexi bacterium]|nr:glycoside hydrolase family 13 protein [Chloroflexota bacterium]